MEKAPLSLVIITLNEEKNIERCIRSVPFASEVIVVDSFSNDKTAEIASKLGAVVLTRKFTNYREQKQWAVDKAKQPWILSLDADECLSLELQKEIVGAISDSAFNGFRIPRLSYHLGRWIYHGGWYPDYQHRLFKKSSGAWAGGEHHEFVKIEGPLGKLKSPIHHYVFKDLEDQIETNNEYSSRGASALMANHSKFHNYQLFIKPLIKFLECYLWKQGFRDGVPGFIIALGAAQSQFFKYAKLWEASTEIKKTT